jgi:iron(III) transport system permease protein
MALDQALPAPKARPFPAATLLAALACLICASPALSVLINAVLVPRTHEAAALGQFWLDCVLGTLGLLFVAGGAALVLGVASAWLAAMCRFTGRGVFEWALVLPLALPAYVLAYAYGGIAGPTGPSPIPLRGPAGAAFVYALAVYPYVYLAARAAFVSQSVCALEAARTLGAAPWRTFTTVALPLARPAIAAGASLALMEIAADFGAASYYGAQTITTGVFRAWFSRGDPALAMQLASLLLLAAAAALVAERGGRAGAAYAGGSSRWRSLPRFPLGPLAALGATAFCMLLVTLGAMLPLAWLMRSALMAPAEGWSALAQPLANSLMLAAGGGMATLILSGVVALASRSGGKAGQAAVLSAAIGYAAPGAVMALGALAIFAALRGAGLVGGLTGAVALAALVWTYAARFAAAGAIPLEAGLSRITPSMTGAARTLGASARRRALNVELPIAAPSAFAAGLIVFVEILKELPATLILRPFDFDTLAVKAQYYAADERMIQAAAPSLLIALVGLAPILILSRGLSRGRAGASP